MLLPSNHRRDRGETLSEMRTERPGIIERAYELARSGRYPTVSMVKKQIRAEGYPSVESYLQGATIHAALRDLCRAARAEGGESPPSERAPPPKSN
jgi:hypothetical protein